MIKKSSSEYYLWLLGLVIFSIVAVILYVKKLNFLAGALILNVAVSSLMFWLYKIFSPNRDDLRKVGLLSLLLGIGLGLGNYELLKLTSEIKNDYLMGIIVLFPILVAMILAHVELGSKNHPFRLALKRVLVSSTVIDIAFLGIIFGMKIAI